MAAVQYKEMLDKQDEARKSYFIRKVSNNEAMVKKLDDVFGAPPRAPRRATSCVAADPPARLPARPHGPATRHIRLAIDP